MLNRVALLIIGLLVTLIGYGYTVTQGNPGWRITRAYPGAKVSVYHATSPSGSPWDLVRLVSPFPYIGCTEYAAISLVDVPYPIRFDRLKTERVGTIYVRDCTVQDISPYGLKHHGSPYVAFYRCNLATLPSSQRDALHCQWAELEKMEVCSLGTP